MILASISHRRVPLLGTSSAGPPTCVAYCLFQAAAHCAAVALSPIALAALLFVLHVVGDNASAQQAAPAPPPGYGGSVPVMPPAFTADLDIPFTSGPASGPQPQAMPGRPAKGPKAPGQPLTKEQQEAMAILQKYVAVQQLPRTPGQVLRARAELAVLELAGKGDSPHSGAAPRKRARWQANPRPARGRRGRNPGLLSASCHRRLEGRGVAPGKAAERGRPAGL